MPLSNANYSAPLYRYFSQFPEMEQVRFSLLDVGASGGIDPFFCQLSPRLDAVGFDPLVSEVDRLNAAEEDPGLRYEACWITQGKRSPLPDGFGEDNGASGGVQNYFELSSAASAHANQHYDYVKEVFNSGDEVTLAETYQSVDEWYDGADFPTLDMLKVDVDGFDFQALNGAHEVLGRDFPLLVVTEAQVQETTQHVKSAFGDIDVYMRNCGYRMLDVDMHRYSRSALPMPFKHDIFAQTTRGGMGACDALYMPDPVLDPDIYARLLEQRGVLGFIKLMIFYDMCGLEDFAAALVLKMQDEGLALPFGAYGEILDLLVPDNPFGATTYADYMAIFEKTPKAFFPTPPQVETPTDVSHSPEPSQEPEPELEEVAEPEADPPSRDQDWTRQLIATEQIEDLGTAYISRPGADGHILFGPYAELPAGSYRVAMAFETFASTFDGAAQNGAVEIVLDEDTVHSEAITLETQGLELHFTVPDRPRTVQIRVSVSAGLRMLLKSVHVTPDA